MGHMGRIVRMGHMGRMGLTKHGGEKCGKVVNKLSGTNDLNVKLARPLCGLTELRDYDPYISDLAALLTGVKPVIYIDLDIRSWPYIHELCRRFKLKYVFPEEEYHKEAFHLTPGKKIIILGFNQRKIREAARQWSISVVSVPWGVALGYPQCCVKTYAKWQHAESPFKKTPDLIKVISGQTRAKEQLSFTVNNIYNYYSRIRGGPKDEAMQQEIVAINSNITFATLQVISWHPCSYNCRKSLAAGEKIFAFMEYYMPNFAGHIKHYLARPVIFFDKYEFVTLDGRLRAGKLDYCGIPGPVSLAPAALFDKIRSLSEPAEKRRGARLDIKKLFSAAWKKKPELLNFGE